MKPLELFEILAIIVIGCLKPVYLDTPKLLFANRKEILMVNNTTSDIGSTNVTTLISGSKDAVALDFLWRQGKNGRDESMLCWSDVFLESIICASMRDLQNPTTIVKSGMVSPDGMGIDWIGNKLYWVDSFINRIEVCDLMTGKNRKVLFWTGVDMPRGLALDPNNGYMYWTDWGEMPKIERGGMNGDPATRKTIISENIIWPNGITIDFATSRIYWVDANLHHIHSANLDGSNRTNLRSGEGELPHPFAITVFEENLYWTDWRNKSIATCNKHHCDTIKSVLTNIASPMDIHVYAKERQIINTTHPCMVNNGGCSHMCLLAPSGSSPCACPTGIKLLDDGKTCADGPEQMIFLARRTDIQMISLDLPDYTGVVVEVKNVKHAIAIDYDPVDKFVYWTDDELRLIQRAKLDGSEEVAIVSAEVMNPDGIAVDWVSRNIFWTDTGTDRIEVSRLNGSSRRVILSNSLEEPRAIAVDPVRGWIFWTDWGEIAKIERAAMDGTERKVLINEDLEWPNGIALDFEYRCMYWADAKLDKIERANFDGTERTVMIDNNIPHVFGFDLVGSYLYWTDWQRRVIERADKRIPNAQRKVIVDQLPDLMGIRAVNMSAYGTETNGCAVNDGGCSHLCLNTPSGYVCACPSGMELQKDLKNCIVPEAFLLFSQRTDIKRVSIKTRLPDIPIHIGNLKNITSFDIHVDQAQLYFADNVNKSIRHACLNGSAVSIVTELNQESLSKIALDWISDNLYFIEETMKRIEVFHLRTGARKVIVWQNLADPRDLVLHPSKGFIFWSDWGLKSSLSPTLSRAKLDGSEQSVIIASAGRTGSLNIDFSSHRLYWVNYNDNSIESAYLDGTDKRLFQSGLRMPHALTVYDAFVYWYDLADHTIIRASKIQPSTKTIIQTGISNMVNLLAYHETRQPGWTRCGSDNGGCEYFCFSTGDKMAHKCACPTHYKLNDDGKTCSAPNSFLLLSERNLKDMQIKRLTDQEEPDVVLPMKHLRNVKTLEYDPTTNQIYWIEGKSKSVKRSSINGRKVEMFIPNGSFSPVSMALDPYARTLFWSDRVNNNINVTSLDKKAVGVIINDPKLKPRAVAIHANKGYLFFISENPLSQQSKVLRTTLDGKNMKEVVNKTGIIKALAIDTQGDRLYWSDHESRTIKSSDMNGADVKLLVTDVLASTIAVYYDKLYYANSTERTTSLVYVDKISGHNNHKMKIGWGNITDVHAVNGNLLRDRMTHPCVKENGGCSHICYVTESLEKRCGCSEGLVLRQNQLDCGQPPTCKPTQFACKSEIALCIPMDWKCDGTKECSDGSDESNCPDKCTDTQFRCQNGECIDKTHYCDQVAHCTDSSDERKCCTDEQFMCPSDFSCISKTLVQDGTAHCLEGEDEGVTSTIGTQKRKPNDPYALGIIVVVCIVSVFIVTIVVFALWKCRSRGNIPRIYDNDLTEQPLNIHSESMGTVETTLPQPLAHSVTATTVMSASTASAGAYDRNHVTGASSSSSSMTHLQHGYNPPPSPVTERSAFVHGRQDDDMSTIISSYQTYQGHSRSRRMHAPPTTPNSTCDDSEPSVVNYSTQRLRIRKKSSRKYQPLKTGEPIPPPPTPTRSQIFSMEDGSECPPSPSTVRSFRSNFNPYPPPPSPEPTSDNS